MPGPPVELPWSLFHGLWLHSLAVAVQGGAAIGVVIGLGFGPPGMIVVGSLGTFAGVILGSVYGLVVGAVGVRLLDPYPGPRVTVRIGRALALSGGVAFDAFAVLRGWVAVDSALLFLPPVIGWLLGPQLVVWYLKANAECQTRQQW